MQIKPISESSIQYIIIQKQSDPRNPIKFAINPTNAIFSEIIEYPRDLLQFDSQPNFFEISMLSSLISPALSILIFDDVDFLDKASSLVPALTLLKLDTRPTVYMIDSSSDYVKILDKIKEVGHGFWYYKIYNVLDKLPISVGNQFSSSSDFFRLIKRDFKQIKLLLLQKSKGYARLQFNAKQVHSGKLFDFNPLKPNYITLHHISEKTWSSEFLSRYKELAFDRRSSILIKIAKSVDSKHAAMYKKNELLPNLPILILVSPFFNPSFKNVLSNKAESKEEKLYHVVYGAEQNLEYKHFFDGKGDTVAEEIGKTILKGVIKPKSKLLDAIAYLHSSFTFSPTLRLPVIGTSIYTELSYLDPYRNRLVAKNVRRKLFNIITKFGNKLRELSATQHVIDYLKGRNGQILSISDLPIEWLLIDNVPLSFTHDVCRIPESNYRGVINNYSAHNKLEFSIKKTAVANTLVILSAEVNGTDDHEFSASYEQVKRQSEILGFHYRYCKTVEEVSKAVHELSPDILIFDCHGDVDIENDTSYLILNGERLYGQDILSW